MKINMPAQLTKRLIRETSKFAIVEVSGHELHERIHPLTGSFEKNRIYLIFDWWDIIRYSLPGKTPIKIQIQLSDGNIAEATATMVSDWKLD